MYSRLIEDLGDFFIGYAITPEIGMKIFNEWLQKESSVNSDSTYAWGLCSSDKKSFRI